MREISSHIPSEAGLCSCPSLIQPDSGHASLQSLEIYNRMAVALTNAQKTLRRGHHPLPV